MAKEIYISSTPHETRLALVEDDQLAEIYYERENEYTLAGSIYKGRVTRVLPGMQSAFVDVGLERDAFLYVTDFIEETEDGDDIVALPQGQAALPDGTARSDNRSNNRNNRNERNDRNDHRGGENRNAPRTGTQETAPAAAEGDAEAVGEQSQGERGQGGSGQQDGTGARRWRGRRGRRRGGDRNQNRSQNQTQNPDAPETAPHTVLESAPDSYPEIAIPEEAPLAAAEYPQESRFSSRRSDSRSGSRSGGRPPRRDRRNSDAPEEPHSHSYETPRAVYDRSIGSNADTTPIILPGESLSKYRRGSEPAPTASTAAASTSTKTVPAPSAFTAKPSTLIEAPLSWDGGLQLPGESLARRRNPAPVQPASPVVERFAEAPVTQEVAAIAAAPIAAEP
ncbi:MAG TPA: hypothetical protein VMU62_03100, partial [Acidobacteriaceae bacterium]|nr:hypothetical protein [Acidobacteriaceae bacterium]